MKIAAGRWMAIAALAAALSQAVAQEKPEKDNIAGPYVPTPWVIVDELLKLADITGQDVVFDLGSGDGRLVIAAAKRFGARGQGVELRPDLVGLARAQAAREGVAERVRFIQGDLFETDLSGASVVTLYLLPRFVERLVPKLRAELKPGSRIVSHDYALSPWPPDKVLTFDVAEKERISGTTRTVLYYYVVPARVGGDWALTVPPSIAPGPLKIRFSQAPDRLEGAASAGTESYALRDIALRGASIRFWMLLRGRIVRFQGAASGEAMSGEVEGIAGDKRWSARRVN